MLNTIGLAAVLFTTTNIDDVFVLISFFSDSKYRTWQVILGQYLGIGLLVAVSILGSLISLVLASQYVGLLGLLPILIGLHKLIELRKGVQAESDEVPKIGLGNILAVAAVTMANGGDNIGIYTPVFATSTLIEIGLICVIFTAMVALWLVFSHWLVNHPSLGAPIRQFGHRVVPFVLIGIGLYVLYEAGTFALVGLGQIEH